jgi:uncharacterized membrane protein
VLVALSENTSIRVLGFLTNDDLAALAIEDCVAVYLPQSYNFAGNLLLVPSQNVVPLDLDSGEVMKFIVAGGVTSLTGKMVLK